MANYVPLNMGPFYLKHACTCAGGNGYSFEFTAHCVRFERIIGSSNPIYLNLATTGAASTSNWAISTSTGADLPQPILFYNIQTYGFGTYGTACGGEWQITAWG